MTLNALGKSCNKAFDPIQNYSPGQVQWMTDYGIQEMNKFWFGPEDNVMTFEEAVSKLTLDKSPGYPYYYTCQDKAAALEQHGDEIRDRVMRVLAGEDLWLPFSLTLKDELRTADRVKDEKTRAFNAAGIVHLIASLMLFGRQNERLHANIGHHPVTLGIQVPGPQFVARLASLGSQSNALSDGYTKPVYRAFEFDGDGCDQRFNLSVACATREIRKAFLPVRYHKCATKLYDDVYCGTTIACGVVHRLFHNKSGWLNTGDDNSFQYWLTIAESVHTLRPDIPIEVILDLLINGDDGVVNLNDPSLTLKEIAQYLLQYNVVLAGYNEAPKRPIDLTFLSHHIRARFVPGLGDILVAAGNREKLLSSIQWVQVNPDLQFEENVVLHLCGLRLCLWPFFDEFCTVETILDNYLKSCASKGTLSTKVKEALRARISEARIVNLHLRGEMHEEIVKLMSGEFDRFFVPELCAVRA